MRHMKKMIVSLTAALLLGGCAASENDSSSAVAEREISISAAVTSSAEETSGEYPTDLDGVLEFYEQVRAAYPDSEWQTKMALPEESLKALSTDDLVEVILQRPYANFGAYNTHDEWAAYAKESIDVDRELLTRDDAAEVLLEKYEKAQYYSDDELGLDDDAIAAKIDAGEELSKDELEGLYEATKLGYYEYVICQKDILSAMTDEQKHRFAETAYQKFTEKKEKGYKAFSHPTQPAVLSFNDEESCSADMIYQKVAEYCG